jgi:hypothetical protein|nr:MAG TPA: hypothetical protein [Caudoviricetes sp.]
MTAMTEWCVLAAIQFTEQFSPCVVLSVHRTEERARKVAAALEADSHWPTTTEVIEGSDDTRKLRVGSWFLDKKIDVIMDLSITDRWSYDED